MFKSCVSCLDQFEDNTKPKNKKYCGRLKCRRARGAKNVKASYDRNPDHYRAYRRAYRENNVRDRRSVLKLKEGEE